MRKSTQRFTRKFSILLSAFIIISSTNTTNHEYKYIERPNHINNYLGSDANVNILKEFRKHYIVIKTEEIVPDENVFLVSAYDLSYQSTQKSRGTKGYGITSSGFDLRGHTLTSARVIATDPSIIPIGSKVRLIFKDSKYKKYDGIYTSRDIGGKIKNYKIDLFIGDFGQIKSNKFTRDFGVTICIAEIIKEDK